MRDERIDDPSRRRQITVYGFGDPTMNTTIRSFVPSSVSGLVIALAACDRSEDQRARDTAAAAAGDTAAAGGMQRMQDMDGGTMMERAQDRMRLMQTQNVDSLRGMLSMHRQMVANMISHFDREMRQMNIKADPQWQATVDSLRQDNIRLPEMTLIELRAFMPAHRVRVVRLMEMHRAMMIGMRM
jgi:hypothetical protein